ncbi:MAG: hypothetical protein U1E76_02620 [Planctomycetota bacterium]
MATNLDPDDMTNRWDVVPSTKIRGAADAALVSSDSIKAVGNGYSCTLQRLADDGIAWTSLATQLHGRRHA